MERLSYLMEVFVPPRFSCRGPCAITLIAALHPSLVEAQLALFHGSATRTRHALVPSVVMTEGVVFLAKAAGGHWLTDVVARHDHDARARQEECQVWRLVERQHLQGYDRHDEWAQ